MFCAIWVQIISQAINLELQFSQDLVISRTIKEIQWIYKTLHLHQEGLDQKTSFQRALKALMRAFPESIGGVGKHPKNKKGHFAW